MKLATDDLHVGQKVTVVRGKQLPNEIYDFDSGAVTTRTNVAYDGSYMGDVLEITAIDLPFVVFRKLSGYRMGGIVLDTRDWHFKALSEEYVKAACED